MYEMKDLPGGKWTFFLIDLNEGRVVDTIKTPPGQPPGPDLVHRAAAMARETGHRYSIAQNTGFVESRKSSARA